MLRRLAVAAAALAAVAWLVGLVPMLVTGDAEERAVEWLVDRRDDAGGRLLSTVGDGANFRALAVAGVVAALWSWRRRGHWDLARLLVVTAGGSMAIITVVKFTTWQDRPGEAAFEALSPSFPSGHATRAAALGGLAAWWLTRRGGPARRAAVWAVVVAAALAVALSRVALGMHFPSDVAVGLALGAGWAAAVVAVYRRERDPPESRSGPYWRRAAASRRPGPE